ncbi:hypothetical protein niasHT_028418 [Heterodera trifolii]
MTISSSASSEAFEQNENELSDTNNSEDIGQNEENGGPKRDGGHQFEHFREKIAEIEMKLCEAIAQCPKKQQQETDILFKEMQNNQKAMLQRIGELEKEIKEQRKLENKVDKHSDLVTVMEMKIIALEKQQKELQMSKKRDLSENGQSVEDSIACLEEEAPNCLDKKACHGGLTIFGLKCLVTYCKQREGWRTVFAKNWILKNHHYAFYFEIKKKAPFGAVVQRPFTYAYEGDGFLWIGGELRREKTKFGRGDVIGCGVDLNGHEMIFTKNGRRLSSSALGIHFRYPASGVILFPCVSLFSAGDLVEANFGPNFKFDPSHLFC